MYRNRTRRHHRTAVMHARRNPQLVTARRLLRLLGFDADFARRFAAQITKNAKKQGLVPAGRTWTTVNGRARATAAYDLGTQALVLLKVAFSYKRTAAVFGLAA